MGILETIESICPKSPDFVAGENPIEQLKEMLSDLDFPAMKEPSISVSVETKKSLDKMFNKKKLNNERSNQS